VKTRHRRNAWKKHRLEHDAAAPAAVWCARLTAANELDRQLSLKQALVARLAIRIEPH
jgi:hypothetical protein